MRGLGRNIFEQEGWRVSIQDDRLGRYESIYIYRELPDRRVELYRSAPLVDGGPMTKIIDPGVAIEPDPEFAIVVPSGFGAACAALAQPGPSMATMNEVRERLSVADARVDKFLDVALATFKRE